MWWSCAWTLGIVDISSTAVAGQVSDDTSETGRMKRDGAGEAAASGALFGSSVPSDLILVHHPIVQSNHPYI